MPRARSRLSINGRHPVIGDPWILGKSEFSIRLRRERERADRSRIEFSLALFDVDSINESTHRSRQARIRRSMRSIDEMGWMGDRSIGVLLPATSFEGARIFADRVNASEAHHRIFTYPDNWIPEYMGDSRAGEGQGSGAFPSFESAIALPLPHWKRAIDIVGSLMGIVLLSPVFLSVAVFIKVVSPGPALFKQPRVGRGGKLFTFIKFRTMKARNDSSAHREHIIERMRRGEPLEKLDQFDPRIIPGGRFFRKTCLDELPQLFNVIKGEMSLVGPRPCVEYEAQEYAMWHNRRFDAVPGMTGLWQVSGKNRLSLTEMIRLDIQYETNMSLLNDLKIILRTIPAIVSMIASKAEVPPEAAIQAKARRDQLQS